MKKYLLFALSILLSTYGTSQISFEDLEVPQDSFLNNSGPQNFFDVGGSILFENFYTADFDSWSGWAFSTVKDTVTKGFANQYAAITNGGFDDSDTYAVGYNFSPSRISFPVTGEILTLPTNVQVTNNVFTYYSMRDGDAFSKKFGGIDGTDPDFAKLTFIGYNSGAVTDSVEFYLADFRFEDHSMDYIVDSWEEVDLTPLGYVNSIEITFTSTDIGSFGINTPTYFCIDDLVIAFVNNLTTTEDLDVEIYPNPTTSQLQVSNVTQVVSWTIYDQVGKQCLIAKGSNVLDVSGLSTGVYHAVIETKNGSAIKQFMKQ